MPISTRSVRSAPRVRVIVGAVLGALLAALILSGRITLDQIIGYVAAVASIVLAGHVATLVTRRQVAPAERGLVPSASSRIELLGTLIVPALLDVGGFGFFGWLRPLPDVPSLRGGRNGHVLRALSVPATHLVLVVAGALVFRIYYHGEAYYSLPWIAHVAFFVGFVNMWLLVLSLVPIPPQAGSVVLERLLPVRAWARYARIRPHLLKGVLGILLVSVLLNLGLTTLIQRMVGSLWLDLVSIGA
jgi:Zn-dependent protease